MDRTDMGTGWEEEDAAEGKVEEQGCWGDMGSRREGGSLGHVSGVLRIGSSCLGCAQCLWAAAQNSSTAGCSWSPEKAWAAASVHVLIDFLEQGMQ